MLIEIGLLVVTLFLWLYWYIAKNFGKWEKLGFPCISGTFPWGSHKELVTQKKHLNDLFLGDYQQFKDKDYFGVYLLGKPVLCINSIDLIRDITVKHFNNFVNRNDSNLIGVLEGGDMDQLWKKNLTSLADDEWKDVRSTFSPIFTSGKMRYMYKFMHEIGSRLTLELETKAQAKTDFELKDVFGKFSLDTLATCAFGIDPDSFKDKDNKFVKAAARVFINTFSDNIKTFSRFIPGVKALHKFFNYSIFKPKETKFFTQIIRQTIEHRRKTGVRENDLIDLMIDCIKEEGAGAEIEVEKLDANDNKDIHEQYEKDMQFTHHVKQKQFNEDIIVATSLVLLVAGYDTTGMTLSFMGYELGKNPETQQKLQDEIDQAFDENGGEMPDYNTIQGLPYLDSCIHEALRLHTPVGNLFRACNADFKLPGTDYWVKNNDLLMLSAIGIHHDERYYPNPHQFNPDNFSKEARQSRSPYTFLGFGQGPRACIGMRFALLEAKVAIAMVMRKFNFLPSNKNPDKLELDPTSQLGYIKNGLYANIELRA